VIRGASTSALVVGALLLALTAPGCGGAGPSTAAYVQRVDRACAGARIRKAFEAGLHRLAELPRGEYARTKALRAAGRSLADAVHRLTVEVRALAPPDGDQAVIESWLDDTRRLAALTGQAAATERRIIALEAHHPGVVERAGTVRNADLERALEAARAAARAGRAHGLDACARLLAPSPNLAAVDR
jgi:hypothetical protein